MKWKDGVREVVEHAMKLAKKKETGLIIDFAVGFVDCPDGVDVVFSHTAADGPHVRATFRLESEGTAPRVGSWWRHRNYEDMQVEHVSDSLVTLVSASKAHHLTVVRYAWPAGWEPTVPSPPEVPRIDTWVREEPDSLTKRRYPGVMNVRRFDSGKVQISYGDDLTWIDVDR